MIYDFPMALTLTILLETPVYLIFYRDLPPLKVVLASIAFNCATLPFVWFVFPPLLYGYGYFAYFAAAEAFALLSETAILRTLLGSGGWERAFLASLCGNGFSAGAGLLLAFLL